MDMFTHNLLHEIIIIIAVDGISDPPYSIPLHHKGTSAPSV